MESGVDYFLVFTGKILWFGFLKKCKSKSGKGPLSNYKVYDFKNIEWNNSEDCNVEFNQGL